MSKVSQTFIRCIQLLWMPKNLLKNIYALTRVAQLVGHHPAKQRVASLIPGEGTCQCCRFGSQCGWVGEATDWSFSLALMFPFLLPFSLKKLINNIFYNISVRGQNNVGWNDLWLISGSHPETYGLELWIESELFANTKSLLKSFTKTLKMISKGSLFKRTPLWQISEAWVFLHFSFGLLFHHFSNTYILNILCLYSKHFIKWGDTDLHLEVVVSVWKLVIERSLLFHKLKM